MNRTPHTLPERVLCTLGLGLAGHGGHEVAKFVSKFMPRELERLAEFKQARYQDSLVQVRGSLQAGWQPCQPWRVPAVPAWPGPRECPRPGSPPLAVAFWGAGVPPNGQPYALH